MEPHVQPCACWPHHSPFSWDMGPFLPQPKGIFTHLALCWELTVSILPLRKPDSNGVAIVPVVYKPYLRATVGEGWGPSPSAAGPAVGVQYGGCWKPRQTCPWSAQERGRQHRVTVCWPPRQGAVACCSCVAVIGAVLPPDTLLSVASVTPLSPSWLVPLSTGTGRQAAV